MSSGVRTCASVTEQRAAMSAIWHYFGRVGPSDEQIDSMAPLLPFERVHAAWDGDRVVGGAGAFPFRLTIPGGHLPAAGVSVVGVLPTHRRRGVLTAMMRAQLDACHARGEAVAYLWASEDRIYGRFGYGLASLSGEIDMPREHSTFVTPAEPYGQAQLVALADAAPLVAPVWERVAATVPGMFARSTAWWVNRPLADPDWRRAGGGQLRCVVLEEAGAPVAYALYRVNLAFDRGVSTGTLAVVEAMGALPAGHARDLATAAGHGLGGPRARLAAADGHAAVPPGRRAPAAALQRARRCLGATDRRRGRALGARLRRLGQRRGGDHRRVLSVERRPLAHRRWRRQAD